MRTARRFLLGMMPIFFAGAILALPLRAHQSQEPATRPEEAATEKEPDPLKGSAAEILRWLNFAIVVGAIGYFLIKKGGPAFRAHANEISEGIAAAAAAKAEADAQLRAAEAGFARLPQDTAALRETAMQEFATESKHLRTATEKALERIEHAASVEVGAAQRAARRELREVAARLAAAKAAELVRQEITAAQRAALVQKFVDELPAVGESRGVN